MRNYITILLLAAMATGCAGKTPRTKFSDPVLRVMIDPDSLPANHHVRVQQALVASGKWIVVDRSDGLRAIVKEQNQLHRDSVDRFSDREKWARWGALLGIGGVVVGRVQCADKQSWFSGSKFSRCLEYLSVINASTGEVIAAVEVESDGESGEQNIAPSWEEAVAKLNDAYPTNYQPNKDTKILEDYRALSKEEAVRRKEEIAKEKAEQERTPASEE